MRRTEQLIADTENKLSRLHERNRKDHARQMILIGATMMAEAERSPGFRNWLVAKLSAALKPADAGAIRRLITRIHNLPVRP